MEYKQITRYFKVRGLLKKQKTILKVATNYQLRYVRYMLMGRLLVYFDDEPKTIRDSPKAIYNIDQITDLQDNYKQASHFMVEFGSKQLVFKCENENKRKLWLKSLQFFTQYYKSKQNFIFSNKRIINKNFQKHTQDFFIKNEITKELELEK